MGDADDRAAITALLHEYAARIDAGDLEGVATLFEEATFASEGAQVLRGSGELLAAQRRAVRLYDGSPRTHHNVTNVVVELDGEAASSRSYYTVLFSPPGRGPEIVITGRYLDRFRRVEGRWRFEERRVTFDQVGDLSGHLHLDRLDVELG